MSEKKREAEGFMQRETQRLSALLREERAGGREGGKHRATEGESCNQTEADDGPRISGQTCVRQPDGASVREEVKNEELRPHLLLMAGSVGSPLEDF